MTLAEVSREHGRAAVDRLIRDLELERTVGFAPAMRFEGGLAIDTSNNEPDRGAGGRNTQ